MFICLLLHKHIALVAIAKQNPCAFAYIFIIYYIKAQYLISNALTSNKISVWLYAGM